jgi:hypothetical protein
MLHRSLPTIDDLARAYPLTQFVVGALGLARLHLEAVGEHDASVVFDVCSGSRSPIDGK